ncbi:MAG TPA: nitrilase-related carbon-nitrogen hydrolase, partial [Actinomycetes bacterium]|nr:nitrilase-related carbon-nitrogen hydrolase [Actinomycetes bacterium]
MDDLRAAPAGPLTVAAGQAACAALDVHANVAAAADLVRRAADHGADLLVLPELFLTGYELGAIAADP